MKAAVVVTEKNEGAGVDWIVDAVRKSDRAGVDPFVVVVSDATHPAMPEIKAKVDAHIHMEPSKRGQLAGRVAGYRHALELGADWVLHLDGHGSVGADALATMMTVGQKWVAGIVFAPNVPVEWGDTSLPQRSAEYDICAERLEGHGLLVKYTPPIHETRPVWFSVAHGMMWSKELLPHIDWVPRTLTYGIDELWPAMWAWQAHLPCILQVDAVMGHLYRQSAMGLPSWNDARRAIMAGVRWGTEEQAVQCIEYWASEGAPMKWIYAALQEAMAAGPYGRPMLDELSEHFGAVSLW